MEFYSLLSKHYDDIFSTNIKAIIFMERYLETNSSSVILDLGAGTGAEAMELAKKGYNVLATDYSPDMVAQIKAKNTKYSKNLQSEVLDMKDVSKLHSRSFQMIYCIGNTFVHLNSYGEMLHVLQSCYDLLTSSGKLIIQIVNYDRIFAKDIRELPVITNEKAGIKFERFYHLEANNVIFEGKLSIIRNGTVQVFTSSTSLLPLTRTQLVELYEDSFFHNLEVYGSFNGDDFTVNSPALIAVLTKK